MNKPSYRSFLLLEMVVSLGLLSLLLATLFAFLLQSVKLEQKVAVVREALLTQQRIQLRLERVFSSVYSVGLYAFVPSSLYTLKEDGQVALFCLFDHGIDPDPAFSGAVMGKIFLDENRDLVLIVAPCNEIDTAVVPYRKEILFSHVLRHEFQFFSTETTGQFLWNKELDIKERKLPPMVRLRLWDENDQAQSFVFFLPAAKPMIEYKEP